MTLRGHIQGGALIFDVPSGLPDGALVEVEIRPIETSEAPKTLYDRYSRIVGIADGLPEDFSVNHDHYIHGTPKPDAQ